MTASVNIPASNFSAAAILDAEFADKIIEGKYLFHISTDYVTVDESFEVPNYYATRQQWLDKEDDEEDKPTTDSVEDVFSYLLEYDNTLGVFYVEEEGVVAKYANYSSSHGELKTIVVDVYSRISADHAHEYLRSRLDKYLREVPEPAPESDYYVWMDFYYRGPRGAACDDRRIYVSPWDETKRNYNSKCVNTLEALMQKNTIPEEAGKLILLHGEPGTGKTSLIRSLAYKWKDWTKFEYIIDAEMFLGDAAYMTQVIMKDETSKTRVIVLEDCGSLIAEHAQKVNLGMARLLNLADGILGQGQKLAFIITTNEPMSALDPAVVRPGRCLAEVHVDRFPEDEAAKWLNVPSVESPEGKEGLTLAEMYAKINKDVAALTVETAKSSGGNTGQYL